MRFTNKPGMMLITTALVLALCTTTVQAEVSNAELLARLESMQQQIDELKLELAQTKGRWRESGR